jgi:hypothetical protein
MKKVKFNQDYEIHWARYKSGEAPEQWFSNEDADRMEREGVATVTEVDAYTKACEAAAPAESDSEG